MDKTCYMRNKINIVSSLRNRNQHRMRKSIIDAYKIVGFFVMLLVFSNCSDGVEQQQSGKASTVFFSLKGYFGSEASRLNQMQLKGTKFIEFQNEKDTVQMGIDEPVNFKEELKAFIGSDINRVAWENKYQTDSIQREGKLIQLTYTATDSQLKTKKINIYFSDDSVRKIQIHNTLKSLIAWSDQYLTYLPGRAYEVKGEQHIRLGKSYVFKAKVVFDKIEK